MCLFPVCSWPLSPWCPWLLSACLWATLWPLTCPCCQRDTWSIPFTPRCVQRGSTESLKAPTRPCPPPPHTHTHTHTPLCFPSSRLVCVCVRVLGGDVWGLWAARRPCPISPLVKCPAGVGSVTSTGCTTVCASCFLASSFLVFPKRKWWETWMAHFWRIGGVPWRSIW